jgi:hypothetical protein
LTWSEAFKHFFPLPDTEPANLLKEAAQLPAHVSPTVGVQIFDNAHNVVASGVDEIGGVRKGRSITFSLSNREKFPVDAEIEWVVRNSGREAEAVNDLGHTNVLKIGNSARESTKYAGLQYMDCIVRRYGQIIGFRRVPVKILT